MRLLPPDDWPALVQGGRRHQRLMWPPWCGPAARRRDCPSTSRIRPSSGPAIVRFPKLATIAHATDKVVRAAVADLAAWGYIRRQRRGSGTHLIALLPTPEGRRPPDELPLEIPEESSEPSPLSVVFDPP